MCGTANMPHYDLTLLWVSEITHNLVNYNKVALKIKFN